VGGSESGCCWWRCLAGRSRRRAPTVRHGTMRLRGSSSWMCSRARCHRARGPLDLARGGRRQWQPGQIDGSSIVLSRWRRTRPALAYHRPSAGHDRHRHVLGRRGACSVQPPHRRPAKLQSQGSPRRPPLARPRSWCCVSDVCSDRHHHATIPELGPGAIRSCSAHPHGVKPGAGARLDVGVFRHSVGVTASTMGEANRSRAG
jgi:hypothetical protein